ncbi:MAG: HAMP domain-containing histidine kinase [Lewinella sp.]|nr:HAMP domain-containing histidine kinase [Lewinella sp.]
MNDKVIRRVLFLGAIAILGIVAVQSYWGISTWNINEEEFHQKASLALYNVARDMAERSGATLPPREVIKQRTSNYYLVNVEYEFSSLALEASLHKELEAAGLNIPFEFAIYNCYTDEMTYIAYCADTPADKKNLELGDLPKDNQNDFNYYFGVKFPTRSGYLFNKMQLFSFLTAILFITVGFFAYAMSVILRQKRLSDMQKDFINNMTHEFKTPISTIKISADVFLNNPDIQENERLLRYAGIIKEQNLRLNHQVEKVLQLAKVEGDNFELKKEVVDLSELLPPILESTRLRVEDAHGQLSYELPEIPLLIRADKLHLTNILHNLLDNAIKYCCEIPVIDVRVQVQQNLVELIITDQGVGIDKDHLPHIFDKFYRVPTGDVHNVKGFGLGLFYVKNICRAHQWKLRLDSESGKGTTVSIRIPLENSRRS